jgi:DNA-binding NarL/FixJ family response regulator
VKVLIIDDSPLIRERLLTLISGLEGIESINQAENGLEAIKSVRTFKPDVMVLDIHMPEGNGFLVLETVKKRESALIAIVFTNHPYPQYRKRALAAGADYFFDKSTGLEQMLEVFGQLAADYSAKWTQT